MQAQSLLQGMQRLDLPGAEVRYWPGALAGLESEQLMQALLRTMDWQQRDIVLFGRAVRQPRLVSFHGDEGVRYRYSNRTLKAVPWTRELDLVRERVAGITGHAYNSVLGNCYRDGADSMGWHADDEVQLGPEPVIVSVSFGAARRFLLRRRDDHSIRYGLDLGAGDLLLMEGSTQTLWQHALPKSKRNPGLRINLTFRQILSAPGE